MVLFGVLSLVGVLLFIFHFWLYKVLKEEFTSIILFLSEGVPGDWTISKQSPGTPMFRDGWLSVNGVSSHVATWGGWVQDPLPEDKPVLVFMCGVPGITLFYHSFLESLADSLQVPVWTICIAGHEIPPSSNSRTFPEDANLYNNVEAQIAHKKAFFNEFVPQNQKLYLVGHSFGAKMVIELLKDNQIRSRTEKCVLLMPTIERFRDTPRAQFWLKCTNSGAIYTFVLLSWVLHYLPHWWRRVFSGLYFQLCGFHRVSDCCVEAMVQFCNPTIFYNVRSLVWNELEVIKQLDTDVLTDLSGKMKVYFAREDNWAPLTHYETLKTAVPGLAVEILDDKFKHAFVVDTPEDMAEIVDKDLRPCETTSVETFKIGEE